jgi:hypothetical protein
MGDGRSQSAFLRMKRTVPASWSQFVGGAVPLLALLCCASGARAACGDYVVTRAHPVVEATAVAQPYAPAIPPLPAPYKPCHGPHCSRGPAVPPLSAPTVVCPTPPEWGWVADLPRIVPSGRVGLLSDFHSPDPIAFSSCIFHPPRRAA